MPLTYDPVGGLIQSVRGSNTTLSLDEYEAPKGSGNSGGFNIRASQK